MIVIEFIKKHWKWIALATIILIVVSIYLKKKKQNLTTSVVDPLVQQNAESNAQMGTVSQVYTSLSPDKRALFDWYVKMARKDGGNLNPQGTLVMISRIKGISESGATTTLDFATKILEPNWDKLSQLSASESDDYITNTLMYPPDKYQIAKDTITALQSPSITSKTSSYVGGMFGGGVARNI